MGAIPIEGDEMQSFLPQNPEQFGVRANNYDVITSSPTGVVKLNLTTGVRTDYNWKALIMKHDAMLLAILVY